MGKVLIAVILVAVVAGFWLMRDNAKDEKSNNVTKSVEKQTNEKTGDTNPDVTKPGAAAVKEFTMTAYYDDKGVWYSLKEMRVKKGDTVRVKVTNTKGMHDFTIDELGVKQELPLNQEVTIEFTADKAGSYVYYCSKPGHRAKGQWGTLVVE